ncbi:MAG: acyl-CoA dehydrogenase [Mycobacterium sp.]|jgi:hypothetical protein|nr:acyl-CoA dehydrogenase [Mycobacterium sp.]
MRPAIPRVRRGSLVQGAGAPLKGIYDGTINVFRNMIPQQVLGLGRPSYSPPKKVT